MTRLRRYGVDVLVVVDAFIAFACIVAVVAML